MIIIIQLKYLLCYYLKYGEVTPSATYLFASISHSMNNSLVMYSRVRSSIT